MPPPFLSAVWCALFATPPTPNGVCKTRQTSQALKESLKDASLMIEDDEGRTKTACGVVEPCVLISHRENRQDNQKDTQQTKPANRKGLREVNEKIMLSWRFAPCV